MTFALIAALVAASPALLIDRAAETGLPCPAHSALEEALQRRLPGVRLEMGAAAPADAGAPTSSGAGDLRASLQPAGTAWTLTLKRADGEVALSRALAFGRDDCALLADTAALVIDRFLEEIHWSGRPATVAPLPLPPKPQPPKQPTAEALEASRRQAAADSAAANEASAAAKAKRSEFDSKFLSLQQPKAETPTADQRPSAPAPAGPARQIAGAEGADSRSVDAHALTISAGPAAWLGLSSDLRAAVLVEVAVRAPGPFEVGLTALGAASSSAAVFIEGTNRGNLVVQSGLLAGTAAACAEPGAFRLCAGPLLGVRASSGSATGRIFQPASTFIVQPEVGLRAAATLAIGPRFSVGLTALGAAALGSGTFNVAGADGARSLPAVDLSLALRLGFSAL